MGGLQLKTDPRVKAVFSDYPAPVRKKMYDLRQLVIDTAEDLPEIERLEETLKWGEPSYLTKKGSTLRMDWKPQTPNHYALYFHCNTRLVDTFRLVYGNIFRYEGQRALLLPIDQPLPISQLKACIKATLTYHEVKHLETLGM